MSSHRRGRRRKRWVALSLLCVITPTQAALADPGPDVTAYKDQATHVQNQIERLTEQYNGLQVAYRQATKASQVARGEAAQALVSYGAARRRLGGLAAASYMRNGGMDPGAVFAGEADPERVLNAAMTLSYIADQTDSRVQAYSRALQDAVRTDQQARSRAAGAQALRSAIRTKRTALATLYNEARQKIAKLDPTQLVNLPIVRGDESSRALDALEWALRELGKPYVWGAAGPNTFDCSGLTMWAYGKAGITLPHYTGSQWNAGTHISESRLEPGDLVFFYSDRHHMGMYVGDGMMIHAPHTGDVVRLAPIAGRPFAGAVRVT